MKRPRGISIIAIVYIILAILSLLWSGLIFGVGGMGTLFGGLLGAENVTAVILIYLLLGGTRQVFGVGTTGT